MASIYIAATVALADLCMAPDKFLGDQTNSEVAREILHYYTGCEKARANPFTQRLREAKTAVDNVRSALNRMKRPLMDMYPRKMQEPKFASLLNMVRFC